jgi:hypothetical protein
MRADCTVSIWKDCGQFVEHLMPINGASFGQAPEEARNAVDEAVCALVGSYSNAGTLDQTIECVFLQT